MKQIVRLDALISGELVTKKWNDFWPVAAAVIAMKMAQMENLPLAELFFLFCQLFQFYQFLFFSSPSQV